MNSPHRVPMMAIPSVLPIDEKSTKTGSSIRVPGMLWNPSRPRRIVTRPRKA